MLNLKKNVLMGISVNKIMRHETDREVKFTHIFCIICFVFSNNKKTNKNKSIEMKLKQISNFQLHHNHNIYSFVKCLTLASKHDKDNKNDNNQFYLFTLLLENVEVFLNKRKTIRERKWN